MSLERRSRELSPLGPRSDAVLGARLLLDAKQRRSQGQFLAEGPQAVAAAIRGGLLRSLYTTNFDSAEAKAARAVGARIYLIDEKALQALSETVNPQGPIAVAQIPQVELEAQLSSGGIWLVCDRISDPGNLGTMIRTAAAAGAAGVITTAGSADVWSGKVVRSSAGCFDLLPIFSGLSAETIVHALNGVDLPIVAMAAAGRAGEAPVDFRQAARRYASGVAWVVGSEAHGVGEVLLGAANECASIPMSPDVESLNAAVAAALCLYSSTESVSAKS